LREGEKYKPRERNSSRVTPVNVVVGGTFDRLHKGHEALLAKAFEIGDFVLIGVTSDKYLKEHKPDWIRIRPVWERVEGLKNFLKTRGWLEKSEVTVIDDNASSPAAQRPYLDAIVVSQETVAGAKEINAVRVRSGMRPLAISIIPMIGADGKAISSTQLRKG